MSTTELHKSSAEILSELFSSFNVEPPNLEQKLSKKHKKSKKKHKRKEKKHKKKSKYKYSSSSSDQSSSEKDGHRKHKSKKRCKVYDSDSSNSNVLNGFEYGLQNIKIKFESELETSVAVKTEKAESEPSISENNEFPSVSLSEKETNTNQNERSQEPENTNMCQETNSDKTVGKISIKNLKNSSVYEATIKEVKEKEQEKAARFEEGELTKSENEDDDIDNIISSELIQKHGESSRHSRKRKYSDGEKSKHCDSKRSRKVKQRTHHRSRSKDRNVREHDSNYYYRSSHSYHESSGYGRYRYKETKKRSRSKERSQSRSSKDRSSHRTDRQKRRSRSPSSSIDKKKLLEIARKNAINMLKSGTLPEALTLGPQAQEKVIAAIKAGGKTIEELTDFCKNLSKKEELGELSSVSSNEDDVESTSDNEKVFHHPFQIKDKPTSIVMNIKNATPLPVKTAKEKSAELRMQFPVSSGQLHRKTENEWVPVTPKKIETVPVPVPVPVVPTVVQNIQQPSMITVPVEPAPDTITAAAASPTQAEMDISSIVSQRLSLMRKLQENPNDVQALNQMYRVQQEMQTWAQSKQQPGQFTGSTGAQILSAAELSSGYQAWARKDQLQNAAPVTGGMGMHLLQKMGWKPGEGLGKEKTGSLEPLLLEVKLDKKGLVANEEVKFKKPTKLQKATSTVKTLAGKHPVSLLGEFATKRKLGVPQYECCFECGPDHKKNFLFKVILNGIEYKPNVASSTKKQAKADAATLCLQQLGLLAS